jgi:hypothetical protein
MVDAASSKDVNEPFASVKKNRIPKRQVIFVLEAA